MSAEIPDHATRRAVRDLLGAGSVRAPAPDTSPLRWVSTFATR